MAPPRAREGERAILHGRDVVPGLAYPERVFSARATHEELWAPLDVLASPAGQEQAWKLHQSGRPQGAALRRFSAYLGQARSFYVAAAGMDVLSRPLAAYYSLLNLSKAWLTISAPTSTAGKLTHGANDAYESKERYRFSQEAFKAHGSGVFPSIAKATGAGYAYPNQRVRGIAELASFLTGSTSDYEASIGKTPDLVPLRALQVLRGHEDINGKKTGVLWIRAQIDRGLLRSRELGMSLGNEAHHFGQVFAHKASTEDGCATYESDPVPYGRNTTHAFPGLVGQFERSLIHTDRTGAGSRYYLVVSRKKELLSQEAVAFAVLLHLSNMVRYRPEQLAKVAASRWSWLLSTWVPRALENSLLTYSTRILKTEMRLAA